ncbi:hypothetical protein Tco_1553458 [Tanacetum coccineum]
MSSTVPHTSDATKAWPAENHLQVFIVGWHYLLEGAFMAMLVPVAWGDEAALHHCWDAARVDSHSSLEVIPQRVYHLPVSVAYGFSTFLWFDDS